MADKDFDIDDICLVELGSSRKVELPSDETVADNSEKAEIELTFPAPPAAPPPPPAEKEPEKEQVKEPEKEEFTIPEKIELKSPEPAKAPSNTPAEKVEVPEEPEEPEVPKLKVRKSTEAPLRKRSSGIFRRKPKHLSAGNGFFEMKKRNYVLGCCLFAFFVPFFLGIGCAAALRYWKPIRIQLNRFEKWMSDHNLAFDGGDAPWKHQSEMKENQKKGK